MTRPHLILIPGTLNDAALWQDQIPALSLVCNVTVADITQSSDMEELCSQILTGAPQRFIIAGFSLGGIVAQEVFIRAPERVTGLGLIDTTMLPDTPAGAARRAAQVKAAEASDRFIGMSARLLESYIAPENIGRADLAARIQDMTQRLGAPVFIRQSALQRRDTRPWLAAVRCPTLILCGESDRITPPALSMEMKALIPHARLTLLPQAGHMTPVEQPELVTAELTWLVQEASRLQP